MAHPSFAFPAGTNWENEYLLYTRLASAYVRVRNSRACLGNLLRIKLRIYNMAGSPPSVRGCILHGRVSCTPAKPSPVYLSNDPGSEALSDASGFRYLPPKSVFRYQPVRISHLETKRTVVINNGNLSDPSRPQLCFWDAAIPSRRLT